MRRSVPILAALASVLLVSTPAAAQIIQQSSGLALYDADGRRVGPVVGVLGNSVDFAMRIDGRSLVLSAGPPSPPATGVGTIRGNIDEGPFFEATGCAGPVLLSVESLQTSVPIPRVLVESTPPGAGSVEARSVLYVPDLSQPPRVATIRSGIPQGGTACRDLPEGQGMVVPAMRLVDFDEHYRRPLHVRAEPAIDMPELDRRVRVLESE